MQIVIPTHGRANKQTTLWSIPPAIRPDVLLVTSTKEEQKLIQKFHSNVVVAPVDSISAKRQWIMENVEAENIFMLDDDMYFFGRCPKAERVYRDRWKANPGHKVLSRGYADDDAVVKMFRRLSERFSSFAHVGLSSRMGNDVVEKEWVVNGRMMHAIGYRRDLFLREGIRFDRVQCREDFHVTLSLLRKGYENAIYYGFCCSPGPYGAPGGASTERTVAQSNAQAELLAKLHPGLVRVKEKLYKNVPRKEVVVQWKKALCYDI